MKRIGLPKNLILLAVSIFVSMPVTGFPGQTSDIVSQPIPKPLELAEMIKQKFPNSFGVLTQDGYNWDPQFGGFYPVGWSPKGLFAYYVEPVDDVGGRYLGEFIIHDLVTDRVLWSKDYQDEMGTIETVWKQDKTLFNEKLKKYGIEYEDTPILRTFPIVSDVETLSVNTVVESKENYGIRRIAVEVISSLHGKKVVSDQIFEQFGRIFGADVIGFLESPYEPRIAILSAGLYQGEHTGPPTIRWEVIGVSLTQGFLKGLPVGATGVVAHGKESRLPANKATPMIQKTIGPAGGVLELQGTLNHVRVEIPADALTADTELTIRQVETPTEDQFSDPGIPIGNTFSFEPDGLQFNRVVTLLFTYRDKDIPKGENESRVEVYQGDPIEGKFHADEGAQCKRANDGKTSLTGPDCIDRGSSLQTHDTEGNIMKILINQF